MMLQLFKDYENKRKHARKTWMKLERKPLARYENTDNKIPKIKNQFFVACGITSGDPNRFLEDFYCLRMAPNTR